MRFRVRCKLPSGQPAIIKFEGGDAFEALAYAGRALSAAGHTLSVIKEVRVSPMKDSKQGAVYVGAVPKARPKRRPAGDKSAAVETARDPGSSGAVQAATQAEKATATAPAATTPAKAPLKVATGGKK